MVSGFDLSLVCIREKIWAERERPKGLRFFRVGRNKSCFRERTPMKDWMDPSLHELLKNDDVSEGLIKSIQEGYFVH